MISRVKEICFNNYFGNNLLNDIMPNLFRSNIFITRNIWVLIKRSFKNEPNHEKNVNIYFLNSNSRD